jgi:hypothetical protein
MPQRIVALKRPPRRVAKSEVGLVRRAEVPVWGWGLRGHLGIQASVGEAWDGRGFDHC